MKVLVSKLQQHPKNQEIYSLSSIEDLTRSIAEVGLLQSIIIDQQYPSLAETEGSLPFKTLDGRKWKLNKDWYPKTMESFCWFITTSKE